MEIRKRERNYGCLSAWLLPLIVVMSASWAMATESDAYTYSHIFIEDSASKLNTIFNKDLRGIIDTINAEIQAASEKSIKWSDTQIEVRFSELYFEKFFSDDIVEDAFSNYEICIDENTCDGWPKFERIFLYPEESIFFEADYSKVTKKFVASQVNVCWVRMGTDKITHMLKDGFRFYQATKDSRHNLTLDQVKFYSDVYEDASMGKTFTGVVSPADVVANLQGVVFFQEFFRKFLKRDRNTGLLQFSEVDLCDYITDEFDERILQNTYTRKKRNRDVEIVRAIGRRLSLERRPDIDRDELLAREPEVPEFKGLVKAMLAQAAKNALNRHFYGAIKYFQVKPKLSSRTPTVIPDSKGGGT